MAIETRKKPGAAEPERSSPPGLRVLFSPHGGLPGLTRALDAELVLGRVGGLGLGLEIDDDQMSRRHARLSLEGGAVTVEDLGSTNGTFVDGARVTRALAAAGAIMRCGDTLFELVDAVDDGLAPPPLGLVGGSRAMRSALSAVDRVARTTLPLLLLGETGTGKELFARRLHARSSRPGRFVAVNCAAIPGGLVESTFFGHKKGAFTGATEDAAGVIVEADRGTLYLDEVGELPLELQPKLLRGLETHEVVPVGQAAPVRSDARLVAATNADLPRRVEAGAFRRDLYARLAGFVLELPPLRQRRGDIVELAAHFLAGSGLAMTADFLEPLLLAPWPMNVRELKMAMERTRLYSRVPLSAEHARAVVEGGALPPPAPEADAVEADDDGPSSAELEDLLRQHRGNVARVAAQLGRHRKQVYRWLERRGLDPSQFR